ncbi:MAG: ABC transporter permease [Muribaculaceae bacterium]|nr:ABC transporter permease [Muribaculaceae bacterium]
MNIIGSLIKKEAIHIVRDRRTMFITLVMPLVLLLLFGFAISTEVNNIKVAVVADRHTDATREIIQAMDVNSYFTFKGMTSGTDIDSLLRIGEIDAALMLRTHGSSTPHQIIVDASNPTVAQAAVSYISSVADRRGDGLIITRTLYNPQMKSSYNFVPGIMGMIFILICAIMTSVSIVREKETGTMDLLLVSPVKPINIIIGKLVPYFILSCMILAIMLTMAYTVLGLPVSGSVFSVIFISLIYIILSLCIGLLISAIVDNQVSALIISAMLFLVPVIMLSGMIFPVDNMPVVLQGVSCIIPARWYISAMRKLMIQQIEFGGVLQEVIIMAGMIVVLLLAQLRKFNSKK